MFLYAAAPCISAVSASAQCLNDSRASSVSAYFASFGERDLSTVSRAIWNCDISAIDPTETHDTRFYFSRKGTLRLVEEQLNSLPSIVDH